MENIFLFFLIITSCISKQTDVREILSLEGEWKFKMDSLDLGMEKRWCSGKFNESVELPGSMAENEKGDEVTLSTDWTGDIVDKSWFTQEKYAKYREKQHKNPFLVKAC